MSRLSQVSEDTLRRLENATSMPTYETLSRLSTVYKRSLLILLDKHASNNELLEIYVGIDKLIAEDSPSTFDFIEDKIAYLSSVVDKSMMVYHYEVEQLILFLKAVSLFKKSDDLDTGLKYLNEAITLSIDDFTLDNIEKHYYNNLETRILLLIGLIYYEKQIYDISTKLFLHCLQSLKQQTVHTIESSKLISKLYYNLSYNYYKVSNYKESLLLADEGINYLLEKHLLYSLAFLYARKGVAEFKLKMPNYMETLNYSVILLRISNDNETADLFVSINKKVHNIEMTI